MKYRLISGVIVAMFLAGVLFLRVLAPVPSSTIWMTGGVYPQNGVYTIWREGNHFYAKDQYGHLAFDDADCYHVYTNITNAMPTEGGIITFAITQTAKGAIFNFSRGILLPTKISLIGQSYTRVPRLSFMQTDSTDCLTIRNSTGGAYLRVENMRITGHAGTTGNGLVVPSNVYGVTLSNIIVDNHGANGFLFNSSYNIAGYNLFATENGEDGFHLDYNATTIGEVYLYNAYAKDNTQDGIEIASSVTSNIVIVGGSFETNGRYGGFFRGGPMNLYGVKFESNTDDQCLWAAQGVISGCYFFGAPAGKYGFSSTSGLDTALISNRFGSNTNGDIALGSTSDTFTINPQRAAAPMNWSINALSYDHQIYGWNNFTATTNATGYWNQTFTFAFTEKPLIDLVLEGNYAWFVHTWYTDANGRYCAALLRVTDLAGAGINGAVIRFKVNRFGG